MDFAAKTVTLRNALLQPNEVQEIYAYAATLTQQGLTDGSVYNSVLPDGDVSWTRNWTTVQAADEWITFITSYAPHSAEVVLL